MSSQASCDSLRRQELANINERYFTGFRPVVQEVLRVRLEQAEVSLGLVGSSQIVGRRRHQHCSQWVGNLSLIHI